ncbi:MAG: DNA polymerase III subunit epsilon [Alphaproteobacteria bacterium]|nr:DNA polymerase III subunit epsilon [Alphaproteobacteria bacterium]
MKEIILDTETTGVKVSEGARVVEIGCLEIDDLIPTGRTFQKYLNPQMPMPKEAEAIHGLSDVFLADKPLFSEIVDEFLEFIGDAPLVIHNASFDMEFINAELAMAGYKRLPMSRAIDTLIIARKKFPNTSVSLDSLCKRFKIDNSGRTFHGALLDVQLLAEVYLHLSGGQQSDLSFSISTKEFSPQIIEQKTSFLEPRHFPALPEELTAHSKFLEQISNPAWKKMENGKWKMEN